MSTWFMNVRRQYLNTLTKMVKMWAGNCTINNSPEEYLAMHLEYGFSLLDLVECGESISGKMLCIEFFESYSSLTFGLFFASSSLYQVLRSTSNQTFNIVWVVIATCVIVLSLVRILSLAWTGQAFTNAMKKAKKSLLLLQKSLLGNHYPKLFQGCFGQNPN